MRQAAAVRAGRWQRGVVEVVRVGQVEPEQLARHALQAVLTAGHRPPLVGDVVDHLRERERHHGEVDSGAAYRQVGDRHGEQPPPRPRRRAPPAGTARPACSATSPVMYAEVPQNAACPKDSSPVYPSSRSTATANSAQHRCPRRPPGRARWAARAADDQPRRRSAAVQPGPPRVRTRCDERVMPACSSRPNSPAGRQSSTAAMTRKTRICASSAGRVARRPRLQQPDPEAGGDRAEDRARDRR